MRTGAKKACPCLGRCCCFRCCIYRILCSIQGLSSIGWAAGCSENAFNANGFTLVFWLCVAAVVLGFSLFQARRMETRGIRLLYLLFMLTVCLILVGVWYLSMQWR